MKPFTEEDIQAFVERETASWQPVPDDVYDGVPDDIASAAKQGDREQLQISRDDLVSVIRQRRDKGSFAKQYELWMTDYTATMMDFMRNPRGKTPEIQQAMFAVVKNGLLYKLTAMERWYHTVFTDTPIGDTPDQEMLDAAAHCRPSAPAAKTGCLVLLFAALSSSAFLIWIFFLSTLGQYGG